MASSINDETKSNHTGKSRSIHTNSSLLRTPLFLSLALSLAATAAAQEKNNVKEADLRAISTYTSATRNAELAIYENPALNIGRHKHSLSQITFAFDHDKQDRHVAQLGDGHSIGMFNAESYVRLQNGSVVWGEASYANGKTHSVTWNETANFLRIYPYVTGDSIGGDFKNENYHFRRGYAGRFKRLNYGAQMSYNCAMSYRTVDPRPKDNAMTIDATIGASADITKHYALGAFLYAEKYNLQQSIDYRDPLGVSLTYQMMGLGMQYVRFGGDKHNAIYKGRTLRLGLTLHNTSPRGFDITLYAENYHLQKQLNDVSYIPINDVNQWQYVGEMAWSNRSERSASYVKLHAAYKDRKGKERIYDDGATNYHEISSSQPYRDRRIQTVLSGAYERTLPRGFRFEVLPELRYTDNKTTYASPKRELSFSEIGYALDLRMGWSNKAHLLLIGIQASRMENIASELRLDNFGKSSLGKQDIERNFEALTASPTSMLLFARYDIAVGKIFKSVYLMPRYEYTHYSKHFRGHSALISIGVTI